MKGRFILGLFAALLTMGSLSFGCKKAVETAATPPPPPVDQPLVTPPTEAPVPPGEEAPPPPVAPAPESPTGQPGQ